jgi:hypothetical protein
MPGQPLRQASASDVASGKKAMATAASTYTWAAYEATLKAYLGISGTSEDTNLELWLSVAAADCDAFVRWAWVDPDTGNDVQHGPGVWMGIAEWVRNFRYYFQRNSMSGIRSKRTGALHETYDASTGFRLARAAAQELWWPDARTVWLQGAS